MTRGFAVAVLLVMPITAAAECSETVADLRWPGGAAKFTVEVADDTAERAQGLMFRESLPTAAGMLFVYDSPQTASFWMKNTLVPLDMIFIEPTGRIASVHENAKPLDTTPIAGGDGIALVLEVNGGLAKRLGIGPGAELRHPAVDQALATWPCSAP